MLLILRNAIPLPALILTANWQNTSVIHQIRSDDSIMERICFFGSEMLFGTSWHSFCKHKQSYFMHSDSFRPWKILDFSFFYLIIFCQTILKISFKPHTNLTCMPATFSFRINKPINCTQDRKKKEIKQHKKNPKSLTGCLTLRNIG